MSDPFVAEIRIVPFNFPPKGWAFCNGQILPINQNQALFSLLGTNFGGNGISTFGLPNLQGATALCAGSGVGLTPHDVGEIGGEANVTLTPSEIPEHTHVVSVNSVGGDVNSPVNNFFSKAHMGKTPTNMYAAATGVPSIMGALAIAPVGGNQPHNNMPPYLTLTFVIALQGIFPSRN